MASFDKVFDICNRNNGNHNLVSLVELRREMGLSRAQFDKQLQELRKAYRYSLVGAEGRNGISEAEQAAAIREYGQILLFVSKRDEL